MLQHVGLEQRASRSLDIVDIKRAIADGAGPRDLARRAELVAVGGESLPGDLAAQAEAADIGLGLQVLPRRQLVPNPETDKRIDPLTPPDLAQALLRSTELKRSPTLTPIIASNVQRHVDLLVPVPSTEQHIERSLPDA